MTDDAGVTLSPDSPTSGSGRKPWERVLAVTVIVATLVTMVWVGVVNWDEYRSLLMSLSLLPLLGALAAGLLGQFLSVAIANISLATEGAPLSLASTYRLIAVGGLAKYIPGGFWQIGSQAGLGRAAGLGFRHSMLVWIEPTAYNVTVGAGLALLAATQVDYGLPDLLLVAGAILAFVASTNRVRYTIYRLVRLIPSDRPVPELRTAWPRQFLLTVAVIALTGAAGMLVVSAFELDATVGYLGSVAAFVGAWVVGFLAIPIPGGIGVREGALVFALAPWMPAHQAVLVAAASRLVATAGELISGLAGVALGSEARRSPSRSPLGEDEP